MKSIVILFPYFGKLPTHFGMWKASAICNSTIDFMLFTDADIESERNIIVKKMQFCDFQKKTQDAFGFPIVLDRPYKLCEYKQAYGYILKDYIKDYDYWGFGDLDLVYGDIRAFITDEVLSYNFILGWGHLTLLRNDEETNTYFMKQEVGYQNYKEAFSTSKITFFDEFNHKGCSDKWRDIRPEDCWLDEPFDNVSKPKQAFHFVSLNRGWKNVIFEHVNNKLYMIRFRNSIMEKRESLYAHFQHRAYMKDKVHDYNHFIVTPFGMFDYPKHFTQQKLSYYCRSHTILTKYYQWKDRIIWKMGMGKSR